MPAQIPDEQLRTLPAELRKLLEPIVENVEALTGQRPGLSPIKALPPGASAADVLNKVNEIIVRMQG